MNADRQPVPLGCREDRPVMPAPQRRLLHRQHQDLYETPILGAALNLVDGIFDVLDRDHDRGAQPRIAIEPFLRDPVVERACERARDVLVEDELHAIEAIQDRVARAPVVADLRGQLRHLGCGISVRAAEIGPRADRRVRRIARQFERAHAALNDRVAPIRFEVRQQDFVARHGRMHVAVDGALHPSSPELRAAQ